MKILHVISSLDTMAGGTSKYVAELGIHLAAKEQHVGIFSRSSANNYLSKSPSTNLELFLVNNAAFKKAFDKHIKYYNYDIWHGHGIWQLPVHWMSNCAKSKKIPYIISPHGMLEPWALNAGKWKKRLALALYQRKDLARAACIHATAEMEAQNIRNLGFRNPIAVIPNGIDLAEFPLRPPPTGKEKKTVLFLSRIHPKKGIELLIEAWFCLNSQLKSNWVVEIAGNGDAGYIKSLQKHIEEHNLASEIKIIGPQFGASKIAAYMRADLFVLPTYSENFGIVVAEALACGVPVITTKGTPWEELNTHKAGWWIEIGAISLAKTLENALSLSVGARHQMGLNGYTLIAEKYSIESVAKQMIELYRWILEGEEKPAFVTD